MENRTFKMETYAQIKERRYVEPIVTLFDCPCDSDMDPRMQAMSSVKQYERAVENKVSREKMYEVACDILVDKCDCENYCDDQVQNSIENLLKLAENGDADPEELKSAAKKYAECYMEQSEVESVYNGLVERFNHDSWEYNRGIMIYHNYVTEN